nr:transmembrane protein 131 [Danaus plexippus plexippus]
MCRKYLWCYVFILTLLDISLNVKLTAQGESHGVSIHNSLVEGITFQEWGKESVGVESVEGVSVTPGSLSFGRAPLAAPHVKVVTVTNTANSTLHLASVAGTTPDFHASFFESKTLPPQANTTFSVVYLGRREGPVSAHLYIHTSLGVHKLPVSAVGVASEYDVWPLVGLRVPMNASVEAELRFHNPTDATVQVSEVYSTGSWLGLRLPGGGERAPRDLWTVPPRATRALVTLRLAHAAHRALADHNRPLTAYIRVRADIPGGGLVVAVEARGAPAGEHARPLHVRLRPRGSGDADYTVELEVANSDGAGVSLEGAVSARCSRTAPPPCVPPPRALHDTTKANGGTAPGAVLTMLRTHLEAHQEFVRVARLKLDYAELWSQVSQAGDADSPEEAWCSGCVRLGRALVPFSVQLLPGSLSFQPEHIDVITAEEDMMREREVRAHNTFRRELRVLAVTVTEDVKRFFHVVDHTPLRLSAGASGSLLRLAARDPAPSSATGLAADLTIHTDLADYTLPLFMYSGRLLLEWEWANVTSSHVELGTVGASWTRRVGVRVRNPAPASSLCVSRLSAVLTGAAASLALAEPRRRCVPAGGWTRAWLTVVAPAAEGVLRGEATLDTPHATTRATLSLRVRAGSLRVSPPAVPPAAPYASSWSTIEVESSMSVVMRVTSVDQPAPPDPALSFTWSGPGLGEVSPGRQSVARLRVSPEEHCRPDCYTGLSLDTPEGAAWAALGARYDESAQREDMALLQRRLALFREQAAGGNFTLHVHTDEVLQLAADGVWTAHWPRLAERGAGGALRAGVGRAATLVLTVRSPATVPMLLHALLPPHTAPPHPPLPPLVGGEGDHCTSDECTWSSKAWRLSGWRVTRGAVRLWNESDSELHRRGVRDGGLLLAPRTELELSLWFTPEDAGAFTAYLYLRNNLTVLEGVRLFGEGEYPSFELAGRRPGAAAPFSFEVKECSWGGGGAVVRRVIARNAGRVTAALGGWRVARTGCVARGFRVSPCAPLALAPNASAPVHLAFSPDYSLARVSAALQLDTDLGPVEFTLLATVPAKVLAKCAAKTPRPPWDGMMRGVCLLVSIAAFALVLGAGALDAERLLRRARASRAPAPPPRSAPLDLRRLAAEPAPAPAVPRAPPRRRRSTRRPLPSLDPRAERRAFERWRAGVLRGDDDSSRSSEDVDLDEVSPASPSERSSADRPAEPGPEPSSKRAEGEPPKEEESPAADEEPNSTGSDASTPVEDRDDEPYGGDVEPDPRDDSPTDGPEETPVATPIVRPIPRSPPVETATRDARPRREASESSRRIERSRTADGGDRRPAPARHTRKERASKRRGERRQPSPPPQSPSGGPGAPGAPAEAGEARGLRWGASWSSVVASRGAPLAPIGSDVRRREPERPADNSLFYFNGTSESPPRPEPEFSWRPPVSADRPAFVPAARDFIGEFPTQRVSQSVITSL